MKAMILAAGRGERMRPLTEATPKPLLKAGGKALIEYHLERLAATGIQDVVINIAYLGEKIREALGDGSRWSLSISYSEEPEPLETAGALLHALPLLGDEPFLLINSDIWTDYPLEKLVRKDLKNSLGHLVLVNNPEHNLRGDFSVEEDYLIEKTDRAFTFSGLSILSPQLITRYPQCRTRFTLGEVFRYYLAKKQLMAEVYQGDWWDIGTVERLHLLNLFINNNESKVSK